MNRSVFRFPSPASSLGFDGERYVSGLLGDISSGDIQSEHYHRYLLALGHCAGKDVLDVASGEGYGSFCLGQVAASVIGVDANAAAVEFANANYLSERVSFKQGRAQKLPIADASIDVVVSFETLEHFAEHDEFAAEVLRVLRPDGLLIISSPNRTVYTEEANYHNEFHVRELDCDEFLAFLKASFGNVTLLAQRPLCGSVIGPQGGAADGAASPVPLGFTLKGACTFERTAGIPEPPFFVAFASNRALPPVGSSVLHNPALMRHTEALRRQAVDEAERRAGQARDLEALLAGRATQVSELERELAGRATQVSELEALLAGRARQVGELEDLLASRAAQVSQLEAALLSRARQAADLEEQQVQAGERAAAAGRESLRLAEEVRTLGERLDSRARDDGTLEAGRAEQRALVEALQARLAWKERQAGSSRRNVEAHLARLRHDLELARGRSEELFGELAAGREKLVSEQAVTAEWQTRTRLEGERVRDLEDANARLSSALQGIAGSTAWKMTWPARRIVDRVPAGRRRQLRGAMRLAWWSLTLKLPSRLKAGREALLAAPLVPEAGIGAQDAALVPPSAEAAPPPAVRPDALSPSARLRSLDPAWIEPRLRPEFARLRAFRPTARLAVVLHLYYPELWLELSDALLNIDEPFDLFVTLVAGVSDGAAPSILEFYPQAVVLALDNHGRDILPLLEIIRSGVLFRYDYVCKLHSKRTEWRPGGNEWRHHLIGGILGSREVVGTILAAMDADPDIGIVVADHQIFTGREYWASNEARLCEFFPAVGLDASSFEKGFAGGSIFWIRPFLFRSIDCLGLGFDDFEPEPLSNDGTTAHAVERLISLVCHDAGMRIEEPRHLAAAPPAGPKRGPTVHLIANYLPQFHPVAENNEWWEEGFTEWTNVTRATALFDGHRQPRLPADLGFYDLRLAEAREAQARLARAYGITAFSYYYYWFNGRKLLQRPIEAVLASGRPDFPFMVCWANEPWTRNWDGLSKEVLLSQDYLPGWEEAFAADVAPLLRDPRYLRLNGRPVLAIYRVMHIPDAARSMRRLRSCLDAHGVADVHLVGGWVHIGEDAKLPARPAELDLDAYFEFPPHFLPAQETQVDDGARVRGFAAHVYDYNRTVDAAIGQLIAGSPGPRYRGVMMGWDNTARRGLDAFVFRGATPASFRRWLRATLGQARIEADRDETAVFVNAWNEWAEGTYLEPDRDFGLGWLEAVALSRDPVPPAVAHEPAGVGQALDAARPGGG